jgi:hypothetical protein
MDAAEIGFRSLAAGSAAIDRLRMMVQQPAWRKHDLARALASDRWLAPIRQAITAGQWMDAHRLLSRAVTEGPQRFVIAPEVRPAVVQRVAAEFPQATRAAATRAERILAGEYDLLGYRGLRFARTGEAIDWHHDPVHDGRPPRSFWSTVPFLTPSYGDHKIIWELNRHQHWLALGRAYWLTGDRRYRDHALVELASWLEANPPLMGINWASMLELALRSLSWIWALHFFADDHDADDQPWVVDLSLALDRQLRQITRNLSQYFSPNTHLLGEALALYIAGRTIGWLARAPRYERIGRRVLLSAIDRQIAPDGGHCERSTHYHRYTLDFYTLALIVAQITDDPAAAQFEDAVGRLGRAARLLADAGGVLPHIGDDDGGSAWTLTERPVDDIRDSLAIASALTRQPELRIGPPPEEAFWLLAQPALWAGADGWKGGLTTGRSAALPHTGYYVSRSAGGDHLVIDGGPHGYQNGGHAHADALSLTLTVRGHSLLIDPGTGSYTVNPHLRDVLRSTALHNTLTLDGVSQSIPAGPFHWRRTANAAARRWRTNAGFDYFEGTHDGYSPLEHRRHVFVLHGDLLVVADLIAAPPGDTDLHRVDVHWHVDPRWTIAVAGRRATLAAAGERIIVVVPHGVLERFAADESGLGWHAPVYGRLEPAATLRLGHTSGAPLWMITVFGFDAANEVNDVEMLPVWAEAGVLAQSCAVRITRAATTDYLLLADPADPRARTQGWRLAEFETDAALMFCRICADQMTRAALVDGTRLCSSGRPRMNLTLPALASDLHMDASGGDARLSGAASGARVAIGTRAVAVATERRGAARRRAAGRGV